MLVPYGPNLEYTDDVSTEELEACSEMYSQIVKDLTMDRPFPIRFELPSPAKVLRVERVPETLEQDSGFEAFYLDNGYWRLWLMANGEFSLGTFIQLLDNGEINRVTWHPDGTETILNIK